jgi:hypothetical protein
MFHHGWYKCVNTEVEAAEEIAEGVVVAVAEAGAAARTLVDEMSVMKVVETVIVEAAVVVEEEEAMVVVVEDTMVVEAMEEDTVLVVEGETFPVGRGKEREREPTSLFRVHFACYPATRFTKRRALYPKKQVPCLQHRSRVHLSIERFASRLFKLSRK